MLGSKVQETLTAAGHEVVASGSIEESAWDGIDLIVADLDVENPEALVGLGMPVLGYYSHVDVETKRSRRGGRGGPGGAALADGPRTAAREPGRDAGSATAVEGVVDVSGFSQQAVLEVPVGPFAQDPGVERVRGEVGQQNLQLGLLFGAFELGSAASRSSSAASGSFSAKA